VKLSHAGDDGLAGLRVRAHAERGILLGKLRERSAQLVLLGLGLGLDRDVDHGIREDHRFEEHGRVLGTEGVAGCRVLEADGRNDVAGVDGIAVFAVIRVHLEKATDAFLVILGRVQDVGTCAHGAGVDTEVGQLAYERVGHDLEGESGERRLRIRGTLHLLAGLEILALDSRDVERRRQVVENGVQ
jgi:hypothetical protein